MGSRHNDDKKVLTFSDSVQDASHRAGFFQARTYPFTIRTALLQHIATQEKDKKLSELAQEFVDTQRTRLGDTSFVGTFTPPNLFWHPHYERLEAENKLPHPSPLTKWVSQRLAWETHQSFGLHARFGRSLENTLSATAYVDEGQMEQMVNALLTPLRNEFGGLMYLEADQLRRFLVGMLYRVRSNGGIYYEEPALKQYAQEMGNKFLLSKYPYMPHFGRISRAPAFITSGKSESLLPIGQDKQNTWLRSWACKTLYAEGAQDAYVKALYPLVLEEAVQAGLMQQCEKKHEVRRGRRVWGLRADAIFVTAHVQRFRCNRCQIPVTVPADQQTLWGRDAMPAICLQRRHHAGSSLR